VPPPALLPPQSRLGGYEIIELVGKGGMGEVYKARQVSMDRVVALKVLSPRLAARDPSFAQQFIAEARSAGRLNHAHIVAVHDVASAPAPAAIGHEGELHFFSMEFIEGETVKDVLERQGRLDPAQVARVMRGMAEALVYAQAQGLIHRDIKPDNIMLGADGAVKLADLGLATDLETATNEAGGKVMGTPLYMSPEQARALAIDHRSDQYSLGATLFHCLTGRAPFHGDSAKAIMKAHVVEPVPDPRDLRDDVPEGWRQLCMRLMAKDPAARFADAAAMRVAIEAAAQGKTARPRTVVHPAYAGRSRRPSRLPWLVGGVVAVGALGAAIVFMPGGPGPQPAPPKAGDPRPPGPRPDPVPHPVPQPPSATLAVNPGPSIEAALAALPKEPRPRLDGLRALIDGPFRTSPERRRLETMVRDLEGDLRAAEVRAAAEQEERFATGVAQVEAALAAGRLADAGDHLAALRPPGGDGAAAAKTRIADLRTQLEQAQARLRGGLGERIAQAADEAACQALAEELAAAALPAADRTRLTAALAERRARIVGEAAAGDAAQLARIVTAVEELRRTPRYGELQDRLAQLAGPLRTADARAQADRFARAVRLAGAVEADLAAHIKSREPEVPLRAGAAAPLAVRLTLLSGDRLAYRRGPSSVSADRAAVDLPWGELAAAAVAPGAERSDALRAFAWHWRLSPPDAEGGDAAFARFLADHDRRLRPLPVSAPCEVEDGAVVCTYGFVARGQALLADWQGEQMRAGPRGLHWDNTRGLPPGELRDKDLPTLRWAASVLAPATLSARIAMDSQSALAIGLGDGAQTVRLLLVNRGTSAEPVRLLTIGAGGQVAVEGARGVRAPPMVPERPVPVEITVGADGQVRIQVGETPIANTIPRLNPAKPLAVVIQTTGPTRAAIPWLQVRGRPPGAAP
jgi:tRNA A-37 threonylcarbamoyl transferase component Bud32